MNDQPESRDLSALEILALRAMRDQTFIGEAFIAADPGTEPPRDATVVSGDVVDPGIVYLCAPGRAAETRLQLDRKGLRGGVIRESKEVPGNQILAANRYALDDLFEASRNQLAEELRTPRPNVSAATETTVRAVFNPMWILDPVLKDPRAFLKFGGPLA